MGNVGKGVRNHLPEPPGGCCAQMIPDPFIPPPGDAGREAKRTPCFLYGFICYSCRPVVASLFSYCRCSKRMIGQ